MNKPIDIIRPVLLSTIQSKLQQLLGVVPAIIGAFLATDDGFEITQLVSGRDMEAARLAAMCSSMVALSHALVQESEIGHSENLIIEAQKGKILLLTISSTPKMSLTVIAKPTATLGQVLVQSKICVAQISEIMELI